MPWFPCAPCCRKPRPDRWCCICAQPDEWGVIGTWLASLSNIQNHPNGDCTQCFNNFDGETYVLEPGTAECYWVLDDGTVTLPDPCDYTVIRWQLWIEEDVTPDECVVRVDVAIENDAGEQETHTFELRGIAPQDCHVLSLELPWVASDFTGVSSEFCFTEGATVQLIAIPP